MPATDTRITGSNFVLGVDGCRNGWICASLSINGGELAVSHFERISQVLNHFGDAAKLIAIDMPIGLAAMGTRKCEIDARKFIGPRRMSVFASPRRPMITMATYEEANAWGKTQTPSAGLSKQAWNIIPKIREVDDFITPALQTRIFEAHPEVAFTRLAGAPCAFSKRTPDGKKEREEILAQTGLRPTAGALFHALKRVSNAKAGIDDILDACVLSLTARDRLFDKAIRFGGDARDEQGLVMEIWG